MKKCPYCAEDIQEDAIKCRFCDEFLDRPHAPVLQHEPTPDEMHKWAEIRRLQRIASGTPTRADNMRKTKGLLALGVIIGIMFYVYMWQKKHEETSTATQVVSKVTFEEFNALFGPDSPLPQEIKEQLFKKYRGLRVTWKGKLTYINRGRGQELFITITPQSAIRAAGIQVNFSEKHQDHLESLFTGQTITYSGKIATYDHAAQFFTLRNGAIIAVE